MERTELNRVLRDRAVEHGLCEKWRDEWDDGTTVSELIGKYVRGIDFCIAHDYPSVPFIRENFSDKVLRGNGIFVDAEFRADNLPTTVAIGKSSGRVRVIGRKSANVYVRHSSKATIRAMRGARVFVEVYDDANVTVTADAESKAFVYRHGGSVETGGDVTVRDRTK